MEKEDITKNGVVAESYEAGLNHLRQFPLNYNGLYHYAMMMEEEDGSYRLYERPYMPCWGALRAYGKKSDSTRKEDPWPEDLRSHKHRFPLTGKVSAISACIVNVNGLDKTTSSKWATPVNEWNDFIQFCYLSPQSPWRKANSNIELVSEEENSHIHGVVFVDCKIDPNIIVNLLRATGGATYWAKNFAAFKRNHPDVSENIALLKSGSFDGYNIHPRMDIMRWMTGNVLDLSQGSTLYDRESYNRPDAAFLFDGKTEGELVSQLSLEELIRRWETLA